MTALPALLLVQMLSWFILSTVRRGAAQLLPCPATVLRCPALELPCAVLPCPAHASLVHTVFDLAVMLPNHQTFSGTAVAHLPSGSFWLKHHQGYICTHIMTEIH